MGKYGEEGDRLIFKSLVRVKSKKANLTALKSRIWLNSPIP